VAKFRAVFDCMVFLQGAARRESAAGACLRLLELDGVELYVSPQIVAELRDVMTRPRVRHKFPALTDDHVNWFLAALQRKSVFVPQVPRIFVYDRDPKDEPYINLAIITAADYLVRRDADLLDLGRDSDVDGERLRRHSPRLRVLDPVEFLVELRRQL
jgi:uncharacterized protein